MPRASALLRAAQGLFFFKLTSNQTIGLQFEQQAARKPDACFLLFGDRSYSYGEANGIINRYASAYREIGIDKGSVACLMMSNRPEFLWHYLALNKLGAVASLVNTNLTGAALEHVFSTSGPGAIVVGAEHWQTFSAMRGNLDPALLERTYVQARVGEDGDLPAQVADWSEFSAGALADNPAETSQHTLKDVCCHIFTSGTTGMPKAALVKNLRAFRYGRMLGGLGFDLQGGDVLYNCLPLYHSNGLLVATSSVITTGTTMALAPKFSASRFFDDCRRYGATSFVYIGELCRYLMNSPAKANDREHKVRSIVGNGLRPDIWEDFQARFGIDHVREFYGSTEGNVGTLNFNDVVGSVGRLMPPATLVRWDMDANDFVRDAEGRLIRCKAEEPGLLIGKIAAKNSPDPYKSKEETEKKVLRDVFKKGDSYFNTGDLLKRDSRRNLFFLDRLGDTFRWRGENVSTFEVQERISSWPPAREVNVYGVKIEGTEGRAGMASVVLQSEDDFDPVDFKRHVDEALPSYSRPVFVRVQREMTTTATMKLVKTDLAKDGFDVEKVADPLYVRHPSNDEYVKLEGDLYEKVQGGKLRL